MSGAWWCCCDQSRPRNVIDRGHVGGSLRGSLVAAADWDSAEVNASIADDFGMGT